MKEQHVCFCICDGCGLYNVHTNVIELSNYLDLFFEAVRRVLAGSQRDVGNDKSLHIYTFHIVNKL